MSRIVCWMFGHRWRPASRGGETCDRCRIWRQRRGTDASATPRRCSRSGPGRRLSTRPGERRIIATLKQEQEAASTIAVSDATISKWSARVDGLEVSQIRRLMALEEENAKLKRLLAEAV